MSTTGRIIFEVILSLLKLIPLNEIDEAHESIRARALAAGLGKYFGFREQRRPRAQMKKTGLKKATPGMRMQAKRLRASGEYTAHELEGIARAKGYKLDRHTQSVDDGARP